MFGEAEPASRGDLAAIERQIGRPPRGRVLVAARCPPGAPAVILTVPREPEGGPVPPLLWLTCPDLSARAGSLESRGLNREFTARLRSDPGALELLAEQEKRLAACAAELARAAGSSLAEEMSSRGVAGGRPGAVKCLHAHLAFRLAAGEGVIGDWCLEMLGADIWDCDDRTSKTCLG
ncbi:MAG: DUF501 domain-containing protein [Actinobacteria bacterium]|nr:DUF501 domain-containing protein [Actinomycetota bacterium]MBU1944855.1 DUF501 domain-containing protein [Actinomycetota bacterium]MBU2687078.1 DUF501 domain-containing protein [Actinomycetota bacterium]